MNYQRIYQEIISNAQNRVLEGYSERHHIVPHCQGGSDEPENLVDLTAREHFIVHWLLMKIFPKNHKLKRAFAMMAFMKSGNQERYRCSSVAYDIARKACAESVSEQMKGQNHPMYGKKHSDETRKKIGASHKGKKLSAETKAKLSASIKGANHHRFKGYYITPKGKFITSIEAADKNGCAYSSIIRWCKANKNGYSFELAK